MSLWVNPENGKVIVRGTPIRDCAICPCCPAEISVALSGFAGYSCRVVFAGESEIIDIVSGVNGGPYSVEVGENSYGASTVIGTRRYRFFHNNDCSGSPYADDTTNVTLQARCDTLLPASVVLLIDIPGVGNVGGWRLDKINFPGTMNLLVCNNRLVCGTVTASLP